MTAVDRVRDLVVPLVADADLDLYDLDLAGGVLQVLVDKPGGADIGVISTLARAISRALDEHDPIDGTYALEVSTPGPRAPAAHPGPLRRGRRHHREGQDQARHRRRTPGRGHHRRRRRHLVTVQPADGRRAHRSRYEDIERARTTFEWGGAAEEEQERTEGHEQHRLRRGPGGAGAGQGDLGRHPARRARPTPSSRPTSACPAPTSTPGSPSTPTPSTSACSPRRSTRTASPTAPSSTSRPTTSAASPP